MSTHLFRAVGSLAALSICYWGIYVRPRRQPQASYDPSDVLTSEEAGRLQERTVVLIQARRFQDALPLATKILATFPDNPNYLSQMAVIQDQLGDFKGEAETWERYLKVAPSPGDGIAPLGNAYRRSGRILDCVGAFKRGVAMEPANSEMLFNLGRAHEWAHQYEQARQVYQQCCALHPGNMDATTGWARMEVFAGDPDQALRLAGKALAVNPDYTDALLVQGMAYRQMGRYDQARATLEHGLRLSPTYGDFMLVLAGVASSQDRTPEARLYYDRYLALHPEDAEVRTRRNSLQDQERP